MATRDWCPYVCPRNGLAVPMFRSGFVLNYNVLATLRTFANFLNALVYLDTTLLWFSSHARSKEKSDGLGWLTVSVPITGLRYKEFPTPRKYLNATFSNLTDEYLG